jgi:glycosyltransferase involved in cell wall biosynthesis
VKILFFIEGMAAGGKERRLTELMKFLKLKTDIQFELVVMNREIHYKEIFDLSINIHYLIRKRKKDLTVFSKFYKICKNAKPDIVHCWDSMTAVYSAPSCKLLKIRFFNGMIIGAPLKRDVHWYRARLTFPFSNVVIGNSKAGLKAFNAPGSRSICIHNGFNFDRINIVSDSYAIRQDLNIYTKYVIGMVATFSESKDYKTYFEAAQLLLEKRSDITFVAIGKDTDSDFSKTLIKDKFLKHFRLLGKRSGIESFINAMDICVLSTFTEGISNSILEYMALGKPVIASFGGGTDEIVGDQKTGFLIRPQNPVEMSQKMEMLLDDSDLRKRMGDAGKRRIQDHFSIENMVDKYLSLCNGNLVTPEIGEN